MAFDGLRNAFSAQKLCFPGAGKEWIGSVTGVPVLSGVKSDQNLTVNLQFKLAVDVDVSASIERYCREGSTITRPLDAMRVVNIVLECIAQVWQFSCLRKLKVANKCAIRFKF